MPALLVLPVREILLPAQIRQIIIESVEGEVPEYFRFLRDGSTVKQLLECECLIFEYLDGYGKLFEQDLQGEGAGSQIRPVPVQIAEQSLQPGWDQLEEPIILKALFFMVVYSFLILIYLSQSVP